MLTIFLDTELKKRLIEIADIEDEINATNERNRKGVSGLLEPMITEWVEDWHADLAQWITDQDTYPEEDAA